MRPERLELEGFTTFRERTEVDFAGADLFALVGPTGAGKSSVVDALCFALYGSVPRWDDRRLVAPVISEGKVEAKVRLDFTVGGEAYSAVRVVRAQRGGATTKEARLVRQADGEVLAGTADELTAAVEGLLGLTFAHFTTCVVLPQGEFMRFLHAKPRDRQDLLVELLDLGAYGRVRSLAREREAAARARRELAAQQAARQAPLADPDRLASASASAAALDDVLEGIDRTQPALDELARRAEAALVEAALARSQAQAVAAVAPPADLVELAGASASASAALEGARAADDAAAVRAEEAAAALAGLPDRGELEAVAAARAEQATLAERVARGESVVADDLAAEQAASAALEGARATAAQAEEAAEAAARADRARGLALALQVGEPCPVCAREVVELPHHGTSEVAAAAERAAEARAAVARADAALRQAETERARHEGLLATLRQQAVELAGRLAPAPDPARVDALLAELARAEAASDEARREVAGARAARKRAEAAVAEVAAHQAGARRAFEAARDAVAALGPPPVGGGSLADDWGALVAWARAQGPALAERAGAAEAAAAEAERAARALADELVGAARAAGVDPGDRLLRDAVVDRLVEVRAEAEAVAAALESAAALAAEEASQAEAEAVAAALARHLAAGGFEKWLLDEVLGHLVVAATEVLRELSGGAYSLTLDARTSNFSVVDHANADAVRSARTLSGGETFLASLALALALADQVAQLAPGGAARLESIFLDEGFGTLDADALDVVAAALEELGSRGRVVGVISHVPELAERLPVRFEVAKLPGGSVVERVEA